MTDAEKKLLQAKHRMEEAQARDRVKRAMELSDLESYLLQKR